MFPESRFDSTSEWKLWGGTKSYLVWQDSFLHFVTFNFSKENVGGLIFLMKFYV
jgi:hypothetical protein